MLLKRVECEQFAGLTDKKVEFAPGLNLVIGENESGKSSLVDLIYHVLFKDIKLDGRSDSGFKDRYFPKKLGGPSGDVIDGLIEFETAGGTYKLRKEWEKSEGSCRLTLPDLTSIKNYEDVEKILGEVLGQKAGIYGEIVFASQRRNALAVESITKALGKKEEDLKSMKDELASTLTRAALETGGVSIELLEKTIEERLNSLSLHWDFDLDLPEGGMKRGLINPWKRDKGEVLEAYYAMQTAQQMMDEAEKTEKIVDDEKGRIKELNKQKAAAEKQLNDFRKVEGLIANNALLKERISTAFRELTAAQSAAAAWPLQQDTLNKVRELSKKAQLASLKERYDSLRALYEASEKDARILSGTQAVDDADLKRLSTIESELQRLDGKLTGLNLVAKINPIGDNTVQLKSASTGEILPIEDGIVQITESVEMSIPGVLEMQLMPRGVDIDAVRTEAAGLTEESNLICAKYGVTSAGELAGAFEKYNLAIQQAERSALIFKQALNGESWETVEASAKEIPEGLGSLKEIQAELKSLCEGRSPESRIGALENSINAFESRYHSLPELNAGIDSLKHELEDAQEKLSGTAKIPAEFENIDDSQEFEKKLEDDVHSFVEKIKVCDDNLRTAERGLGEKTSDEYKEQVLDYKDAFEAKKAEYKHWHHISEVFYNLREKLGAEPNADDIRANFSKYLELISDGRVALQSLDETMSAQLSSGTNALSFETLSKGTYDTISLAFRLAMLEHIFPDGGGLAIFDDPFTDMDASRKAQSCKLITEFAKNNQVVFITCDDSYKASLDGNVITM